MFYQFSNFRWNYHFPKFFSKTILESHLLSFSNLIFETEIYKIYTMNCPCCSGKIYSECCEPFHKEIDKAASAEALMRSRYSAFALANGTYLWETTAPRMRKYYPEQEYQDWAVSNQWIKLEILSTPQFNQVEFKAYFKNSEGINEVHHELSTFEKINGKWYYVSGDFIED